MVYLHIHPGKHAFYFQPIMSPEEALIPFEGKPFIMNGGRPAGELRHTKAIVHGELMDVYYQPQWTQADVCEVLAKHDAAGRNNASS